MGENLIKSKIEATEQIKKSFLSSLEEYIGSKMALSGVLFQEPRSEIIHEPIINKFKKTLTDWRSIYSESKSKKTKTTKKYERSVNQGIKTRLRNQSLSFAKNTSSSNDLVNEKRQTSSFSCRKIDPLPKKSKEKDFEGPFNPSIISFVLAQNIYESSMRNFNEERRARTARVRKYYEKKASWLEEIQAYEQLSSKIGLKDQEEMMKNSEDFTATQTEISLTERKKLIYQRKSKRILMPNEYFPDLNKAKMLKKYIFKAHPISTRLPI